MQTDDLPVTIYTPESQLRTPGRLLRLMARDFLAGRELAWRLFIRDISARYRQSILGIFWAFFPPILTGLLFIFLQAKKIVYVGSTDIPYPVFVLVGTTLWQLFTESLNAPIQSINGAKSLLSKINFPWEALILAAFYNVIFNLLIKSAILACVLLFFRVEVTWAILLSPFAVIMLIILGMTLGLLITPLGMIYSDFLSALSVATPLWFFITPVVYSVPQAFPYSLVAILNPVSPILIAARDLLTIGHMTNVMPFFAVSAVTLFALLIAWLLYRLAMPILIQRMSS